MKLLGGTVIGLGSVLVLFNSHNLSAGTSQAPVTMSDDEALCGKATGSEVDLGKIQKDMPPISNQNPTSWCYAFSAMDLLNYYIHQTNRTPYDPGHMISPIDAVAAQRYYDDQFSEGPLKSPKGHLDIRSGGYALDVLMGAQEVGALRSRAQVRFSSNSSKDPEVLKVIQELWGDVQKEQAEGESPSAVSDELRTFKILNRKVYDAAVEKKWTNDKGNTLDHYHELMQTISGDPSIKLPPFVAGAFYTKTPTKLFRKINEVVSQGYPVSIPLCVNEVIPPAKMTSGCEGHEMTIVGVGYVGGACTVRLRNSWGTNPKKNYDGYSDLKVAQFVKATVTHFQPGSVLSLYWVTPPDPKTPPALRSKSQLIEGWEGDGSVFMGNAVKVTKNGLASFKYQEGTVVRLDGFSREYVGGIPTRVNRMPLSNGGVYSGEISTKGNASSVAMIPKNGTEEWGNGTSVTYRDGKIWAGTDSHPDGSTYTFKDGILQTVERMPAGNGKLFSGNVQQKGTEIFLIKGVFKLADGSEKKYP